MEVVEWNKRVIMGRGARRDFIVFTLLSEEAEKGDRATHYEGTIMERGKDYIIVKMAYPVSMRGKMIKFLVEELHILRRLKEVEWGRTRKRIFRR